MKRVSLTAALALFLVGASLTIVSTATGQNDYWGALAYSNATGRYGFSYDYATRARAINEAVMKCGVRDCRGVVWFHNGCGAFARGRGAWGWGIGNNRAEAESRAIAECRQRGGYCRTVAWACTTR